MLGFLYANQWMEGTSYDTHTENDQLALHWLKRASENSDRHARTLYNRLASIRRQDEAAKFVGADGSTHMSYTGAGIYASVNGRALWHPFAAGTGYYRPSARRPQVLQARISQKRSFLKARASGEQIAAEPPKSPLETHSRFLPLKRSRSREFRAMQKS